MSAATTTPPDRRVPVRLVAHLFPVGRHGRDRKPSTIARYIRDGIQVGGATVKLAGGVDTDGRRWWTTAAAVEEFLRRLTAAKIEGELPPAPVARRADQNVSEEFRRLRGERPRKGR